MLVLKYHLRVLMFLLKYHFRFFDVSVEIQFESLVVYVENVAWESWCLCCNVISEFWCWCCRVCLTVLALLTIASHLQLWVVSALVHFSVKVVVAASVSSLKILCLIQFYISFCIFKCLLLVQAESTVGFDFTCVIAMLSENGWCNYSWLSSVVLIWLQFTEKKISIKWNELLISFHKNISTVIHKWIVYKTAGFVFHCDCHGVLFRKAGHFLAVHEQLFFFTRYSSWSCIFHTQLQ